jgi:prepilin-type N-terminal cleavage/methylation domain-containing protein
MSGGRGGSDRAMGQGSGDRAIGRERRDSAIGQERGNARAGFSLIEVIVAMVVLTVGLLGLAAGTGWMIRTVQFGQIESARSTALQSAVESVRAAPFASMADGSGTYGEHAVAWTLGGGDQRSRIVQFVVSGPGRERLTGAGMPTVVPNAVDTFTYRIVRRD